MEGLGLSPPFWRNKRILLTGHTGFKGSWLSLWLQQLGANITGFALAPDTTPNLFELAGIDQHLVSCIGDIQDYQQVSACVQQCDPEIIIHMAAQPIVSLGYQDPLLTFNTNVMGTANLLQAARECKNLQIILVVTSDKCYDNANHVAHKESDPLGGDDPYSASKAACEMVAHSFRESFFKQRNIHLATARAGNVFGGGDWSSDRLIPDIMRSISNHENLLIRSPDAIRPWQFVLEPLCGYLLLLQKMATANADGQYNQAWNFGPAPQDELPVRQVLAMLADIYARQSGKSLAYTLVAKPVLKESLVLKLDSSKARTELGWQPRLDILSALAETVSWYQRAHEQPTDVRKQCLALLDCYIGRAAR